MKGHGIILVVDDDHDVRAALRELLEREGYRVCTAEHGQEAMDIIGAGLVPCLILLDLVMPVMSGWQMLDAMAQAGLAEIPVIVVSASVNDAPTLRARFIRKPIDMDRLVAAVREHCPSTP